MKPDWSQLVLEHGQTVFRAAYRILGNTTDAEDTAQEVFLEASTNFPIGNIRNWGAYLTKLSVFRALDLRRRRRNLVPLDSSISPIDTSNPCDEAIHGELAERMRDLIASLPEREGVVFALRYHELMSNPQIAAVLGISVGAVAAAIHKVRSKLESMATEISINEVPRGDSK